MQRSKIVTKENFIAVITISTIPTYTYRFFPTITQEDTKPEAEVRASSHDQRPLADTSFIQPRQVRQSPSSPDLRDEKHGVKMGVPNGGCDDAKVWEERTNFQLCSLFVFSVELYHEK